MGKRTVSADKIAAEYRLQCLIPPSFMNLFKLLKNAYDSVRNACATALETLGFPIAGHRLTQMA